MLPVLQRQIAYTAVELGLSPYFPLVKIKLFAATSCDQRLKCFLRHGTLELANCAVGRREEKAVVTPMIADALEQIIWCVQFKRDVIGLHPIYWF